MFIVGIDYSMTCPAVCVHCGKEWSFGNCRFYFLTDKKKCEGSFGIFEGAPHSEYLNNQHRFYNLSKWVRSNLPDNDPVKVFLEGYSFGSTGSRVFDIGECGGVLKQDLWLYKYDFAVVPPTVIKKFATGKGNSNKIVMSQAFQNEVNLDLEDVLGVSVGSSPASDIIDAYYIAKWGFAQTTAKTVKTV
jgi:Holliday junction resolvasome RuvABC endonuclease subunit